MTKDFKEKQSSHEFIISYYITHRVIITGACTNGWTNLGVMQANFTLWLPLQCPCCLIGFKNN